MRKRVKGLLLLALILCVSCSFISYAAEQKDTVESVTDKTLDSEIEVQEEEKSEESTSESAPIHTGWYEDRAQETDIYIIRMVHCILAGNMRMTNGIIWME